MKKFTVYKMAPYFTWGNVEAKDEDAAIKQCQSVPDPSYDCNEPESWLAVETEGEDE